MVAVAEATQTVAEYFNAHARVPGAAGKKVHFISDVRSTLDHSICGEQLNKFLLDVLDMGERLQGVETSVRVFSANPRRQVMKGYGDLPLIAELEKRGVDDWLIDKGDSMIPILQTADMIFDDEDSMKPACDAFNVIVGNPKEGDCQRLLASWVALGESDEGRVVQEQVFQAWYNGQQFEI